MHVGIVANASGRKKKMNREAGVARIRRDCCSAASISRRCNLSSATPLRWFSLVSASVGCRPRNVGRDVCSATICPVRRRAGFLMAAALRSFCFDATLMIEPLRGERMKKKKKRKKRTFYTRLYRFQERRWEFDTRTPVASSPCLNNFSWSFWHSVFGDRCYFYRRAVVAPSGNHFIIYFMRLP